MFPGDCLNHLRSRGDDGKRNKYVCRALRGKSQVIMNDVVRRTGAMVLRRCREFDI